MLDCLPLPAVIVDLETTGGRATFDRITEVGLITVDADGVREWSTLVNPGCRIPGTIERLTGITNAMVADAPSFGDIARDLHERLEGRLFIAHNVRFDHGFLRNEFARVGIRYAPRLLCTVRLSRALWPQEERHGLDALITRHGLAMDDRHRAMADARAVHQFLEVAGRTLGPQRVADAIAAQLGRQTLPPGIDPSIVDALPSTPGVYLFHGDDDVLLYVGKSKDIRARVLSHFAADHASNREMRLAQQVRRIDWEETAGELGALLREARLVKERQPLLNRQLRRQGQLCSLRLVGGPDGLLRPEVVFARDLRGATPPKLYGLFPTPAAAKKALQDLAAAHGLCRIATGLEKSAGRACSARQVKRCLGWCEGAETSLAHNLRLMQALESLALRTWPFPGPVGFVEENEEAGLRELHVVENWCWLGTARDESDIADILAAPGEPVFDRDTYKLLVSALRKKTKVVPLRRPPRD